MPERKKKTPFELCPKETEFIPEFKKNKEIKKLTAEQRYHVEMMNADIYKKKSPILLKDH